MTHLVTEKLKRLLREYPKPASIRLSYGTAGFRAEANTLKWVMIRVGVLAAFRSKVKRGSLF